MIRLRWQEARRYVLAPGLAGLALLPTRRRTGLSVLGLAGAVALFFRDPERPDPTEPAVVYAAADGIVRSVDADVHEPWLDAASVLRVSVFLSLLDVHINRSPVSGRITRAEELGTRFAPAFIARSEDNYRHRLAIDGEFGPLVLVLISGLVARTISRWKGPGDPVAAGERLSLIHFGSRTDVLLPADDVEVLVSAGDRVRAGVTPLARYRHGAQAR